MVHIYIFNGMLLQKNAIKKNEIFPFATTRMDLEGIMLSAVNQTKPNTVWYHLYVESEKYNN